MDRPFTTVALLRKNARDLHLLSRALQCAYPQQIKVLLATHHRELVHLLAHHAVDVVVSEFRSLTPNSRRCDWSDGLLFLRYLSRRRHRPLETIVLLSETDAGYGDAILEAGATAFVMESEAVEGCVEALQMGADGTPHLYMEVREMVLSDEAGEPVYSLNARDPEARAALSAVLAMHGRKLAQALDGGPLESLMMEGPGCDGMFEMADSFGVFVGPAPEASVIHMGAPPPGSTLEERLEAVQGHGAPQTVPGLPTQILV